MKTTQKAVVKKIEGGMKVQAQARGFTFICDEPPEAGGTDQGMTPVEALLCALGSCQTIVAISFAHKHGIDLKGFRVELEGDIDPDGYMGKNPNVRNGFSEIRVKLHFETDAPEEKVKEYAKFMETACPVGDNVNHGVPIVCTGVIVH